MVNSSRAKHADECLVVDAALFVGFVPLLSHVFLQPSADFFVKRTVQIFVVLSDPLLAFLGQPQKLGLASFLKKNIEKKKKKNLLVHLHI